MPPKKPRPADTGGVTKPMRTGTLTGETPVKEHIEKIEKNGGKEPPKPTEEKKSKGKGSRNQPVKAHRRMPTLQEGVEESDWDWETPKKHSTPKGERKGEMEEEGVDEAAETNASTPGGSKTGQTNEKQGPPEPPPGPKPGGGTGSLGNLKQQEELQGVEKPERQQERAEKVDEASNWASEPPTYMPTEEDVEKAPQEEGGKNNREANTREGGGIKGEAGRLWAEKAKAQQQGRLQRDMSKEKCYRCGRFGHTFYRCDYTRHSLGYGLWWGEGDCYHCGQQHPVVKCPKLRGKCWACGERGHAKDDCPLKDDIIWEERICKLCHAIEHLSLIHISEPTRPY